MLTWSTRIIFLVLIAFPLAGICQTGFYMTSPCNKGDADLRKFDPESKNLCLVASPIVAIDDIASVSGFVFEKGRQMFEMRLTAKGYGMLQTAFGLSPVVAFVVENEIFFIMDTGDTKLYQTLKIFQSEQSNFHKLHNLLSKEIQIASRE